MHSENQSVFRKMARDEKKLILARLYICKVVDGLEGLGKRKNVLFSLSQFFSFFFFLGEKYHGNSLKSFNYKAGKRKEIY